MSNEPKVERRELPHPNQPTNDDPLFGPRISAETLKANHAPLSCTLLNVSLREAANIVSDIAFGETDTFVDSTQLGALIRDTIERRPLSPETLTALAAEQGEIFVHQNLTLFGGHGKLTETFQLGFTWRHPDADGVTVYIKPATNPRQFNVTLDWLGEHRYRSAHVVGKRWNTIEMVLDSIADIETSACSATPLDGASRRYALTERATVEVMPRDPRHDAPAHDPHLTQRNDIRPLCVPPRDLTTRTQYLLDELERLFPPSDEEKAISVLRVSRTELAQLEHNFLVPRKSADDFQVVIVENVLLVATRASTGFTLLEDVKALDDYQRQLNALETPVVKIDQLAVIEAAVPASTTIEDFLPNVDRFFAALDLPRNECFTDGLARFVTENGFERLEQVRSGLIDALVDKKPASVDLSRAYFISERSDTGDSPIATVSFASAYAGEISEGQPHIGFRTPTVSRLDSERATDFEGAALTFFVVAHDRGIEPRSIPGSFARDVLTTFGYSDSELKFRAVEPSDYAKGESIGYLSQSLRVEF